MAWSVGASRLLLWIAVGVLLASCAAGRQAGTPATVPQHAVWESSAKFGIWHDGDFDVFNNEWNAAEAGPQTVWADSFHSWGVVSTQADTTGVKTYPSVQENFRDTRLTSLRRLTSSFAESMPPAAAAYKAEAAYDLWFNDYRNEVMVWVDNHGQQPNGIVSSEAVLSGQHFRVYRGNAHMVSLVLLSGTHENTGSVNLLLALRWLVDHGYLRGSSLLTQVDFGWEIVSTDGIPLKFTLHSYSLSVERRSASKQAHAVCWPCLGGAASAWAPQGQSPSSGWRDRELASKGASRTRSSPARSCCWSVGSAASSPRSRSSRSAIAASTLRRPGPVSSTSTPRLSCGSGCRRTRPRAASRSIRLVIVPDVTRVARSSAPGLS
jgi:hypothetical protein